MCAAVGSLSGTVKSYSVFKGFGFILSEDGGPDIFLHMNSVTDGSIPSAGDTVTFDLEPADTATISGQMKAVNVRGGTGYPITAEQKGKGKEGKGKDAWGAAKGGWDGMDGPYGKGENGEGGESREEVMAWFVSMMMSMKGEAGKGKGFGGG